MPTQVPPSPLIHRDYADVQMRNQLAEPSPLVRGSRRGCEGVRSPHATSSRYVEAARVSPWVWRPKKVALHDVSTRCRSRDFACNDSPRSKHLYVSPRAIYPELLSKHHFGSVLHGMSTPDGLPARKRALTSFPAEGLHALCHVRRRYRLVVVGGMAKDRDHSGHKALEARQTGAPTLRIESARAISHLHQTRTVLIPPFALAGREGEALHRSLQLQTVVPAPEAADRTCKDAAHRRWGRQRILRLRGSIPATW